MFLFCRVNGPYFISFFSFFSLSFLFFSMINCYVFGVITCVFIFYNFLLDYICIFYYSLYYSFRLVQKLAFRMTHYFQSFSELILISLFKKILLKYYKKYLNWLNRTNCKTFHPQLLQHWRLSGPPQVSICMVWLKV